MPKSTESVSLPTERTTLPTRIGRLIVIVILGFAVLLPLYAYSWSDIFLWRIQKGMSEEEVRRLVGEPIKNDGGTVWDYTRRWSRDARVVFGTDGLVSMVETD